MDKFNTAVKEMCDTLAEIEAVREKAMENSDSAEQFNDTVKQLIAQLSSELDRLRSLVIHAEDHTSLAISPEHDMVDDSSSEVIAPKSSKQPINSATITAALAELALFETMPKLVYESPEKWQWQVLTVIKFTFRGYFGRSRSDRWGSFVDQNMSPMIARYSYWINYPDKLDHPHKVWSAAVSEDGRYLFTASGDDRKHIIFRWDLYGEEEKRTKVAHSNAINCLVVCSDLLFSGSSDNRIKIWNWDTFTLTKTLKGHTAPVRSIALNNGRNSIVSGSADKTIRLWGLENGKCLRVMSGHTGTIYSVIFLGDRKIISASSDKSMKVWKNDGDECEKTITEGLGGNVTCLTVNSDGSLLGCVVPNASRIQVYRTDDLSVAYTFEGDFNQIAFHPSKPYWLAVSMFGLGNYSVRVMDLETEMDLVQFTDHKNTIRELCFTPAGVRLISASFDKAVRLWNTLSLLS